MTLHIELMCRARGPRLSLRWVVRHPEWAATLMSLVGCRDCMYALTETMRTARAIR